MRIVLLITLLLAVAIGAIAETCTPSGENYIRFYPPQGTVLNHLPATDPRCVPYSRDTFSDSKQTPLCFQCHPHQYQGWMAKYWRKA